MRWLAWGMVIAATSGVPAGSPDPQPAPSIETPAPREAVWLGVLLDNAVDGGVQVVAVVPRGPAASAGVLIGDVILSVNGKATPDRDALGRVISELRPGERARIAMLRGSNPVTRDVEVARRSGSITIPLLEKRIAPEEAPMPPENGWSGGISVTAIPRELRVHYGAPGNAGVLVTSIDPEGAAAAAGVRVGDVVVKVDGTAIQDESELLRAFLFSERKQQVPVDLVRNKATVEVQVRIASARAVPFPREVAPPAKSVPGALTEYDMLLGPGPSQDRRIRKLEVEIERLEQRILELEEELQQVKKE